MANDGEKVKRENEEEVSSTAFLINFNDHLQIVTVSRDSKLKEQYTKLMEIDKILNSSLKFDKNEESGFLSVCPTNCGSGLKVSAFIKIPKVINDGNLQLLLNKWSLRSKKNLVPFFSETFEILSKCKIKVDVTSFLNSFKIKISSLLHFEEKLDEEPSFLMKKITNVTGSTKKLYEYFFDNYKLVSTKSGHSSFFYNNQFTNLNNETEVSPTSYLAPHVYRDFFNDYITGETGVNMVKFIGSPLTRDEYDINKHVETSSLEGKATLAYDLSRNLKDLDFFNSEKDKINLLSQELENKIFEDIKKVYVHATKQSNSVEIADHSTTIYLATHESISNTNGNHIRVIGSNLNFIEEVLKIIEGSNKFAYDPIFGYLARNILNSGSGLVITAEFNKSETHKFENASAICERNDLKLIKDLPEKIVVKTLYSVSKPKSVLIQSLIKLSEELFPVIPN